jgi:prephenate dehydratase
MKIAIQGEAGSFSHEAALKWVPKAKVVPCPVSREVFARVVEGKVEGALIPVENSLAGPVVEHLDLLLESPVFVEQEFRLRIAHTLIAAPGVRMGQLRRVYSHPVALQQCRDFFKDNPRIQAVPFYDTAGSVKHVVENTLPDAAGIAGKQAAAEYGGRILKAGIEDDKQNYTRFFLVRKFRPLTRGGKTGKNRSGQANPEQGVPRILPGANKTSIVFALKNDPGVLFKALSVFALRDIDLTHIESRPIRGRPWEYVFYVDYRRGKDEASENALRHLAEIAKFVKVIGIYPEAR